MMLMSLDILRHPQRCCTYQDIILSHSLQSKIRNTQANQINIAHSFKTKKK